MVMSARNYGSGYPNTATSPPPTAASSLNYSQYGNGSYASPSRNPSASVSSSFAPPRAPLRSQTGESLRSGNAAAGGSETREKPERKESKEVARKHWLALRTFLAEWLERESPTARASARDKLTRLTKLQFQELSTDVYDELVRRQDMENGTPDNMPFLPVRQDFHPKRNQARQKLATLPANRFKDLASDVFHELRRRYPEFEEEARANSIPEPQSDRYEEPPAPGPTNRPPHSLRQRDGGSSPQPRLNSQASSHLRQGSRNVSGASAGSGSMHRSRPSRDLAIPLNGGYAPDDPRSRANTNDKEIMLPSGNATTNDVVIPNKSRMREEEEIQVPYARDSIVERPPSALSASSRHSITSSAFDRPITGRRTPGDAQEVISPQTADDRQYYDRMSFSSNVTNKSRLPGSGQVGWDPEMEKRIRSDYEFKIAGLERKLTTLESQRGDGLKKDRENSERHRELEDEVRGLKERAALHASNLRSLQHELDLAKDSAQAARGHNEQSSRQAQLELSQWRERCESLEKQVQQHVSARGELEAANAANAANAQIGSGEAVAELKREIHSLVDELNALSARNEDLVMERERDAQTINEMEAKVEEYKRMYDAVRVELRNLKATSMLFTSRPATEDHLPASPDGNVADVHVSAFQTSIDGMLTAARSSTPSGVLPAMKAIVEAITDIGEDVKAFEAHPNLDVDVSRLESLKHESTTRLNNLMQAARNHAMASGLSPVSLIDGAAGHLSSNVIEIIKLLRIRRTDKGQLSRTRSNLSIKDMVDRSRTGEPAQAAQAQVQQQRNGPASGSATTATSPNTEEYLRDPQPPPSSMARQLSAESSPRSPVEATNPDFRNGPTGYTSNGPPPNLRINSYQSSSSVARSDSFDLERNASMTSERPPPRVAYRHGGGDGYTNAQATSPTMPSANGFGGNGYSRASEASATSLTSGSTASGTLPVTAASEGFRYNAPEPRVVSHDDEEPDHANPAQNEEAVGSEQEWDDVKPYLEAQSSALVNSIQNLLAAIRTGGQTPALNEHLSEVIAISSSIVAVASNALPPSLRFEGSPLIKDLVENTNRLSEAQEMAKGGAFDKSIRQTIASASFGVAKSLKALMRLGKVG